MAKKKSNIILYNLILYLILVVAFLFTISSKDRTNTLAIGIQGLEPAQAIGTWNGIPIKINAPIFGSISNTRGRDFCNSNDGDVTISTTYSIKDDIFTGKVYIPSSLTLDSVMSAGGRGCGGNEITASFEVPKGRLRGTCILSGDNPKPEYSDMGCGIRGLSDNRLSLYQETKSRKVPFELTFDKPTIVEAYADTSVGKSGTSSATLSLEMIKSGGGGGGGTGGGGNNNMLFILLIIGAVVFIIVRMNKKGGKNGRK